MNKRKEGVTIDGVDGISLVDGVGGVVESVDRNDCCSDKTATLPNRPQSVSSLKFDTLIPYSKHPFKLYEGQRLADMAESIKANSIISPPIVRPHPNPNNLPDYNGKFEILSGHNRINAAKIAGYTETQCVVVGGLTDDDAHLYVTESNLVQRSFADLSHSERAAALASHYEAMKGQGKRNDLVGEIENIILNGCKADEANINRHPSPLGTKTRPTEIVGEKYGLGKTDVARYIRLNTLIDDFKGLLDTGELSMRAGYSLSFLSANQQNHLHKYTLEHGIDDDTPLKITMKQAEHIKQLALEKKFSLEALDKIFAGKGNLTKPTKPKRTVNLKYKRIQLEAYFDENETDETISATMLEAIAFYRQYHGKIQYVVAGDGIGKATPAGENDQNSSHLPQSSHYNTSSNSQPHPNPLPNPSPEPTKEGLDGLGEEARANVNASLDAFFNML